MKSVSKCFLLLVAISIGCSKQNDPQPMPTPTPPVVPVPSGSITASPSTVGYGDSTIVSRTYSNATSVSDGNPVTYTFKLTKMTKDTLIKITVTGTGGTKADSVKITVTPADPKMLALAGNWKFAGGKSGNTSFFEDYQKDDVRTFSIDKTFYDDLGTLRANPTDPAGRWGYWFFKTGTIDSISIGSAVWGLTQLSLAKDTLILSRMIIGFDSNGNLTQSLGVDNWVRKK